MTVDLKQKAERTLDYFQKFLEQDQLYSDFNSVNSNFMLIRANDKDTKTLYWK